MFIKIIKQYDLKAKYHFHTVKLNGFTGCFIFKVFIE